MSEQFKRERRYVITKIGKPDWNKTCVVVEEGWPEYEIVWKMIQDRMEGRPNQLVEALAKIEAADGQETVGHLSEDGYFMADPKNNGRLCYKSLYLAPPITSEREKELQQEITLLSGVFSREEELKAHIRDLHERFRNETLRLNEQLKIYQEHIISQKATEMPIIQLEAARIPEGVRAVYFVGDIPIPAAPKP